MSLLLKLLPFKWWAIGALAAVLVAAFLTQSVRIRLGQHDYAEVKRELVAEKADRAIEQDKAKDAALVATGKYRAMEAAYSQQLKDAQDARLKAEAQSQHFAAQYRDAVRMRDDAISAFARGRGPAETAAEAQRRAEALGSVLQEALRVAGELAIDSEANAADARLLYDAWPR